VGQRRIFLAPLLTNHQGGTRLRAARGSAVKLLEALLRSAGWHMRKRDKDNSARVVDIRKNVMREIRQDVKEGREGEAGEGRDTYDIASDERDREINLLLGDVSAASSR